MPITLTKTKPPTPALLVYSTTRSLVRKDFSEQCWIILNRMLKGEKLTMRSAVATGIGDIRRRATDLIQFHKIPVKRNWAIINNIRQNYKWYYLEEEDIALLKKSLSKTDY